MTAHSPEWLKLQTDYIASVCGYMVQLELSYIFGPRFPDKCPRHLVERLGRTPSRVRQKSRKILHSRTDTEHLRRIHPLRQRWSPKEEFPAIVEIEDPRKSSHPYINEIKCPKKHPELGL